ncbi:MarR family winged helix-turn-helix transcriptional regulator [Chitinophaga horti]|uniref:MarR family winged helix-turn-helix transcriptional regulator n=1 Tax=Chitinophaga horti TaxID=2920382 RepID=A0ABY6IWW9_9BACT|nr:MarR family winged helix-turn-helix transcriptional regulator [Chitinophaga horti]UYQ91875.1 MarR family winged helix-turn-helix transcriptional regulator [Chitinophaga horti]
MAPTRDEKLQAIISQRSRSLIKLVSLVKKDIETKLMDRLHSMGYENFKMGDMVCLANVQLDGTINNELAKKAKITKQAMSKVVKSLETEGYIYTRKHETDNRASVIYLTDRGKDLAITAFECVREIQADYVSIIGEDDSEKLREILTKLLTKLDML